jgi:hypothetical protein
MNRRRFLETAALAGIASTLSLDVLPGQSANGQLAVAIPDDGWRLWTDTAATWKDDAIYLPEDVVLEKLPRNPPTGGWQSLHAEQGIAVTLPTTVEQFYWGLQGLRPYHDEYKFEADDPVVRNGAYYGVSWWWRDIEIPSQFQGKRIRLHIRGARQRAEVYLNQTPVGYSVLEELPFECDLTLAARPGGRNQLAIRITNPGGRLDWVDKNTITWGKVSFQKSHGFGGLDRALTLTAHDPVRFADAWVLNTADLRAVTVHAEIRNDGAVDTTGRVRFSIIDPRDNRTVAQRETAATVKAGMPATVAAGLRHAEARLWDIDTPNLYRLEAQWTGDDRSHDLRSVEFGFRWFAPEGVGSNAIFRLNGRRTRIYTAISWGYWALNGLWPTPELALKEVEVAKRFNLNCLNFHRNLAKEDVLVHQDRLGLMRCLEPGGGILAVAGAGHENDFGRRYMEAKVLGMIRAFRSHPSVVEYILQNEASPDLKNPGLERILRKMQALDPSRAIVSNDGFATRSAQAWLEPYSDHLRTSAEGGAGGWWDEHSGQASDVWRDSFYVSPSDHLYNSNDAVEIVEWGEMKGAAAIDDHAHLVAQIEKHGGKSYDLGDHQELLSIYENFLDRHQFRAAFPTASALFQSIGRRAYESWGQFMENIRLTEANDYAAISGWESTAMENHSGIVDNFRDYKSDPQVLSDALLPVRPLAKQKHIAIPLGEPALFDLYLLNDSGKPVAGKLTFTLTDPAGNRTAIGEFECPAYAPDRLSYLIRENVSTQPLNMEGVWRTTLALNGSPRTAHVRELYVVNDSPQPVRSISVGTSALSPLISGQLDGLKGLSLEPFQPGRKYDVVVASAPTSVETIGVGTDDVGADKRSAALVESVLRPEIVAAFEAGIPLLVVCTTDGQAAGVGKQLSSIGAFHYDGMVGASRASWMGTWYFVRRHPIYAGLPIDRAMSIEYQVRSSDSNGLIVDGPGVEIVAAYSRDHDRKIGAGTFVARKGAGKLVLHRICAMHPVFHRRLLANAIQYLAGSGQEG